MQNNECAYIHAAPLILNPIMQFPRDIVFIISKYIIKNSEECVAITYASIIDTGKPEYEFDITGIPLCKTYCMITVCVNHTPKKTEEFIHFGADCIEYNSVTRSSNIKIKITILYNSQSVRFKHLEATGINFQKYPTNHYNMPEISSDKSKTRSIINIIADNIDPVTTQTSNQSSSKMMPAFIIPNKKINLTSEKKNQSKFKIENNDKKQQNDHKEEKGAIFG
ncbi:919_t:CDS:2 [Gigaspora margarita]|uniref:919_t:CDS:1 n=1 Tax=Gigaspora margarita TaxID=4874 RepID=A0ABN7UPD3_GIGMA|nr:919_t:CDS:2 [Gigaspora margarita]